MTSNRSDQSTDQALSHSKSRQGCAVIIPMLFGGSLFIFAGTMGLIYLFLLPVSKYLTASSWIQTPCEIISSRIGSEDDLYFPEIKYKYTTHGEDFQGEKHRNYEVKYSSHSSVQDIVNQFRRGMKTDCYVNPDNISEAVLNPDFSVWLLLGLIPVLFIFAGAREVFYGVVLIYNFPNSTKSKKEESQPKKAIAEEDDESGILDLTFKDSFVNRDPNGMVQLQPEAGSFTMFFTVLFMAFLTNAMAIPFASALFDQWAAGKRSWFETPCLILKTVFMIPYVAFGVGLIVGAFYMFLKCFNPKLQVWVSDQTVELGSSFKLQWKLKGSTRSIRRFQIQLVGTVWTEYQEGTSTYGNTKEFYRVDLFQNEKEGFDPSFKISSGQLEVQIPSETMHSFSASNTEIKWSIHIKGDIRYWPNINEEFELTILPFQGLSSPEEN